MELFGRHAAACMYFMIMFLGPPPKYSERGSADYILSDHFTRFSKLTIKFKTAESSIQCCSTQISEAVKCKTLLLWTPTLDTIIIDFLHPSFPL